MAFMAFIGVFVIWGMSARPMLRSFGQFIGIVPKDVGYMGLQVTPTPTVLSTSYFPVQQQQQVKPTVTTIPTMVPTMAPTPTNEGNLLNYDVYPGKYSYYWPPLGGINCDTNPDGSPECEHVANGDLYTDWVGLGVACDSSIPLGSRLYIVELDQFYTCIDRGYLIKRDIDNRYWFDFLTDAPAFDYGTPITVYVSRALDEQP